MKKQGNNSSHDHSQDIQFVSSYLTGNRLVQEILYKKLQQLIAYFMRILENKGACFVDKDNTIADIIFQILVKNDNRVLRAYDGRSKLTTYLWPIVRNRIIDSIRSEKRYRDRMSNEYDMEWKKDPLQEPEVHVQDMIHELFAGESPLEKHIKILKWVEGSSYQDIIRRSVNDFPQEEKLNSQKIASILHSNRKKLYKKYRSGFDI
jgi:DNA-directed RNA polymerase specialized sigma24 family protein